MREKLIELLNAVDGVCPKDASCYDCEYKDVEHCAIPAKADYLIANGVTVQEWISVKDRLPKESGDYLAYCGNGYIGLMSYSTQYKLFNTFDGCGTKHAIAVTHWMPLPEAPKGE